MHCSTVKTGMEYTRCIFMELAVVRIQIGNTEKPAGCDDLIKLCDQRFYFFDMVERQTAHNQLIVTGQRLPLFNIDELGFDINQLLISDFMIEDIQHTPRTVNSGD